MACKLLLKAACQFTNPGEIISFLVQSVQLEDEGVLYQKFLQLKHDLKTRGYFDDERKKAIPRHPDCVGIVTSSSSAAVQDIIRAFSRRNPGIQLLIYPTAVQGETAPREIAAAIELANARDEVDVLMVSRGGGSMEDLAAFNDRIVADAIFNSKIPVVTGIGHQTDVSIADYVADKYLGDAYRCCRTFKHTVNRRNAQVAVKPRIKPVQPDFY